MGAISLLVRAPGLLADQPSATLAAIVISASFVLFDGKTVLWLWRVRRSEFLLSLGGFLGVVLVGILEGLVIAVSLLARAGGRELLSLGGEVTIGSLRRDPSLSVITNRYSVALPGR